MAERTSGTKLFLKQAREEFFHVGAIAPSSRFLARAVGRMIPDQRHPVRVLEAGAGTGALTSEILLRLPPGSHLDIYEINPDFASHLAERFVHAAGRGNGHGNGARVTVAVHNRKVQEVPADAGYDVIVSGLPLNNFAPRTVQEILETLFASLKPHGTMAYFEYILIREIKSLATGKAERKRLRRIGRITGSFLGRYEFRRESVFLNIPPAVVHYLRKPA
jgi:phospholipid N-methyltransferase